MKTTNTSINVNTYASQDSIRYPKFSHSRHDWCHINVAHSEILTLASSLQSPQNQLTPAFRFGGMCVVMVFSGYFFNSVLDQLLKMNLDGHGIYMRAQRADVRGS